VEPQAVGRERRDHLDPKLFSRIETLYNNARSLGLMPRRPAADRTYESFVRNGAKLSPEQKQQLSGYNQQLAIAVQRLQRALLADEGTFHPGQRGRDGRRSADVKAAAASVAKDKGLPPAPTPSATPARLSSRC
jgi:peptidyl-dipeptidase Dcp